MEGKYTISKRFSCVNGRVILGQTISQRSKRSMSLFHFLPDNFAQLDPLNAPVKFTKLFIEGREREGRLESGTYILQS